MPESKPHSKFHDDVQIVFSGLGLVGDGYDQERVAALQRIEEQFEALRDIAVRVSEADNHRLAAEGEPGFQAMREMEDALAALHQFVASNPASRAEP